MRPSEPMTPQHSSVGRLSTTPKRLSGSKLRLEIQTRDWPVTTTMVPQRVYNLNQLAFGEALFKALLCIFEPGGLRWMYVEQKEEL